MRTNGPGRAMPPGAGRQGGQNPWRRDRRGARTDASERESGFALILVITVMTAILLGGLAAVDYVTGYLPIAQTDENRQAALAAAEAGVDDYVNRLNVDPNYWDDGSDASNVAMQGGGVVGGTVPNTGPWGWVAVAPGSSAEFHYYADTTDMTNYKETDSATASWGTIYITSTGKVGNVTRTIQVGVRQADFLSNLYLSNYNLLDPIMAADWPAINVSLATAEACVVYAWQANPAPGKGDIGGGENGYGPARTPCFNMFNYWITNNVVDGPMQSNDDYYVCGDPQFDDSVTTADPNAANSPYWLDHGCEESVDQFPHGLQVGGDYMADAAGQPMAATYQKTVPFPANGSFIESYASATANANLGCLYYGPTAITFSGTTPTYMYVYSPDTQAIGSNTGCLGTGAQPWTTPLNLPANGVIYVANLPSSIGGSPTTCTVDSPSWAELDTTPGTKCLGNAFVQGTADGQVTVAADNNIYLVAPTSDSGSATWGSLSLSGGDVMGLAASKFILINHDITGDGADTFGPFSYAPIVENPTINAAIFAVNDALGTSDFWDDIMGNLVINGAIVSNFMDAEGTVWDGVLYNGYNEIYKWDSRLAHLTPPYFIPPDQSQWAETTYSELPAENG